MHDAFHRSESRLRLLLSGAAAENCPLVGIDTHVESLCVGLGRLPALGRIHSLTGLRVRSPGGA